MDSRKMWGLLFIITGVMMYQASGPLANYLTTANAHPYLVAASYMLGAVAVIPMILGLYRLFTQGKKPAP